MNSNNPFAQRLAERNAQVEEEVQDNNPFAMRLKEKQYEKEKRPIESLASEYEQGFKEAGRHIARLTARGLELPFEMLEGFNELRKNAPQIAIDQFGIKPAELFGKLSGNDVSKTVENLKSLQQDASNIQKDALNIIPGKEDIRNFEKSLVGNYLEPQTPFEKFGDEVLQDLMLAYVGQKKPGQSALKTALKTGGAVASGQAVKQGLNLFDAPEWVQDLGKAGGQVVFSMFNQKKSKDVVNELYDTAKAQQPKNAFVDATDLEDELFKLKTSSKKVHETEAATNLIQRVDEMLTKIKNGMGRISLDDLIEAKREMYKIIGDYKTTKESKELLKQLPYLYNQQIEQWGTKNNPDWLKAYRTADLANAANAQGNKISNYIKNTLKDNKAGAALSSFFVKMGLGPLIGAKTLGTGLAGYGILKGGEAGTKLLKSPELRKNYMDMIINANKENAPGVFKSLTAMKKNIEEENKKITKSPERIPPRSKKRLRRPQPEESPQPTTIE